MALRHCNATASCWLTSERLQRLAAGLEASGQIEGGSTAESEAERALRERQRQFADGITSYSFSNDGLRLLVPHAGRAFLFEVAPTLTTPVYASPSGSRQTDITLAPSGKGLSLCATVIFML